MPRRTPLVALAAVAAVFIGAGSAQAAPTETVTNLNDAGAGSLREALANVDAGGTVTFTPTLAGTIDLQTALQVDKSFTLTGPGARQVTIDAAHRDNILIIGSNTPGNYVVVVQGLTFFRGAARSSGTTTRNAGGAISFASGNSLTVRNAIFRQNYSTGDANQSGGGAISVAGCTGSDDGASLTVESSTFARNGAYSNGGAIAMFSKGALAITGSEFRSNVAEDQTGGGAVLVYPSRTVSSSCQYYSNSVAPATAPITISDSHFEGNGGQADDEGPAISFQGGVGPKTIRGTDFIANGNDGYAGAIYDISPSAMVVEDSLFEANGTGDLGGAIQSRGGFSFGSNGYTGPTFAGMFLLDIKRTSFIGNSADVNAGAVYYEPTYKGSDAGVELELRITDSEFAGNSSPNGAGAVRVAANANNGNPIGKPVVRVSGSRFVRNFGNRATFDYISKNTAATVAGVVEIRDSVFDNNIGGDDGAAILLNGDRANTAISNVAVTRNTNGDSLAVGLDLSNDSSPDSQCDANTLRSQYGLSNVTVAGNVSGQNYQGAVNVNDCGSLTMESSTVALNLINGPYDDRGSAGLSVVGDSTAVVRNSIIAQNSYGARSGPFTGGDCYIATGSQLAFDGANLIGTLVGCGSATGTAPITGNPGFAELDPTEVQNIATGRNTVIVPLASNSRARGAAVGSVPSSDQRGAARPSAGADLGAVQYYENHTLTVAKAGAEGGMVLSDVGAIDCGTVCAAVYAAGDRVTLRTEVSPGIAFTGWSGACTGIASTCVVTMDAAKSVTATFTPVFEPKLKLTVKAAKKVPAATNFVVRLTTRNTATSTSVTSGGTSLTTATNVKTCFNLPKGLVVVKRGGGTISGRTICWTRSSLAAGTSMTQKVTLRTRSTTGPIRISGTTSASTVVGEPVRASFARQIRIVGPQPTPTPEPPTG